MQQLLMPNVGEGVQEGTVTRWLKQEGDVIELDEPVVEVETDKAVVEVPSPYAGKLVRVLVAEGETVPIGAALAEFETSDVAAAPAVATAAGGRSAEGGRATRTAEDGRATRTAEDGRATRTAEDGRATRTRQYSPVVLKIAAEHDVDLALVRGTGIEGRVTKQDLLRYVENPVLHAAPPPEGSGVVGAQSRGDGPPARATTPTVKEDVAAGELVPLTATRRTIAARMVESVQTIPAAWMMVEADVTGLVGLRSRIKDAFRREEGVELTYLPFFVRAIVAALKHHTELCAVYSDEGMRQYAPDDVGIAVATEWGLVVPVLRGAGDLSVAGLAKELARIAELAGARKLAVEDMRGAGLTINNTGSFGSIASKPIVPPGQAAIITTEAIRRDVRVVEGDAIAVRSVMNLCLSFDHRGLDGDRAGRFMQSVRENVEAYKGDTPV